MFYRTTSGRLAVYETHLHAKPIRDISTFEFREQYGARHWPTETALRVVVRVIRTNNGNGSVDTV